MSKHWNFVSRAEAIGSLLQPFVWVEFNCIMHMLQEMGKGTDCPNVLAVTLCRAKEFGYVESKKCPYGTSSRSVYRRRADYAPPPYVLQDHFKPRRAKSWR